MCCNVELRVCIDAYLRTCISLSLYIYIYIYIERERERCTYLDVHPIMLFATYRSSYTLICTLHLEAHMFIICVGVDTNTTNNNNNDNSNSNSHMYVYMYVYIYIYYA